MVHMKSIAFLSLVAASASAVPLVLEKRIAQTISASTTKWEQTCLAANGGQACNPLSIKAFSTLLAASGPCEQQDAADDMMDLAKKLNSQQLIVLTQIFTQQPKNTPNSVATPYCQKAPRNSELSGLFQCQFQGANQQSFAGGAKLGDAGTIPFGRNAPLSPPGSCPANPSGPIADGTQLVDLTQSPNAPGGSAGSTGGKTGGAGGTKPVQAPAVSSAAPAPAVTPATPAPTTGTSSAGGFKQANGQAAQGLNAKFAGLTADSPCTAGENACVKGGFAQCVGGKFVVTQCSGGLVCAALPLVNSAGTSITCTTTADAEARIAATGATGGITGSGAAPAPAAAPSTANAPAAGNTNVMVTTGAAPAPAAGDFKQANGKDAQALNAKFAGLTAASSCNPGENACVQGGFAQCVAGKFVITQCAGGLVCAALPLVNSRGTSTTCTTTADAQARIAATGVTGGITGA
ncbi:hypothetical protein CPB83DRAFT_564277 [Crepidotus variabilis]|uniref:Carbohydrate-binding module family 19 domain-containing protein n=1 Tax=Crepidotus variabilis TaxID=179855 RepID=A0A9P6JLC1_9AGAR|nr:hypothetical protein CPB83DRAFT_564277 [Crepidotus variabilis]